VEKIYFKTFYGPPQKIKKKRKKLYGAKWSPCLLVAAYNNYKTTDAN
jgi:hypothetical protein